MADSPEELALRAIREYLVDEGFHVEWDSVGGRMVAAVGGSSGPSLTVSEGLGDKCRVSFMMGELMLVRSTLVLKKKKMALDLGAVFFDIGNPECFDQVVKALRGEYLPEVKSIFDPSNQGSGGFFIDG